MSNSTTQDTESVTIYSNKDRAVVAAQSVRLFADLTGLELTEDDDYHTAISDLIANLHHLSDAKNQDWDWITDLAEQHYGAEIENEEQDDD